ncbi:uncharacterized protein BO95DRAFT_511275 [Aspergillus brunneoviolaceus CBS 621.78]|uniref:Uncharacterized protein n=1 Tax=Aspergillus brunneoviolaceus CBS 621.78 TaxID=1450534 RepID=A0ACD1GKX2_9EURO|nr:hypothetical protein BO95DRAFT_511275 [Aspergillus brunneoviolaceus CBS 621.78]RAH49883.1 hypothetical protein BO95DRAFT_511275 [Aspergillus brunneoviolaceus CBS 621.78]
MSLESQAEPPSFFGAWTEEECWFPSDEEDSEYPTYNPESDDRLKTMGLHYYLDSYIGGAWPADETSFQILRSDPRLKGLYELPSVDGHSWQASLTYIARSDEESRSSPPHFRCLLRREVAGDERLLRGELITIVNSMINRLSFKSTLPHTIAPVMVYSLKHTQQVRILEACFNGQNLVVSSTKLYDMMTEDTESLELFL